MKELIEAAEFALRVLYQTESYNSGGVATRAVEKLLIAISEAKQGEK